MLDYLSDLGARYPRGRTVIPLSRASASLRAPGRPLREFSIIRIKPAQVGDPLPIRGNCFPLRGHPLPPKPSETRTGQLGTRLAPSNRHRSVEWLTRKGAPHVVRAGLQHRALRPRVRGHGSRSGDALATTRVRETLAMHYDRYGRTLSPTRRARRVQRGRLQRGRRTPRVLVRGTTGGRDARRR